VQGTATVSSEPSIVYHPIPELLHHLNYARLGMGRYRYQILDTIDTKVLKKSIDTDKKYRCFDISAPAIFFHFGQRHHHENDTKKPK
jgi:hypothetical protein